MLKKITLSLYILFASVSSLLALSSESLVFYTHAGIGGSNASAKVYSADAFSEWTGNSPPPITFKDAKNEQCLSWSFGFCLDYLITDSFVFTGGLFIDKTSFNVVYESDISQDAEFKFNFLYLNTPVGLRIYGNDFFMVGCGLYLGVPLSTKVSLSHNEYEYIKCLPTIGLFIDIGVALTGFNRYSSSDHNLMVFARLKNDLTYTYKGEYPITNIRTLSVQLYIAYGFALINWYSI